MANNQATVTEEYVWGVDPATIIDQQEGTVWFEYEWEDGAQYHTISATYRVTVSGAISGSNETTLTMQMQVYRPEFVALENAWPGGTTAGGAGECARMLVRAVVDNGFGGPANGYDVTFALDPLGDTKRVSFAPGFEPPWTDETEDYTPEGGDPVSAAYGMFGSGDTEDSADIMATGEWGEEIRGGVGMALPLGPLDPEVAYLVAGDSVDLSITLGGARGLPCTGHWLKWVPEVRDADGALIEDPDPALYGGIDPDTVGTGANGYAEVTYEAGSEAAQIQVEVYDTTCFDGDFESPLVGYPTPFHAIYVCGLESLSVSGAQQVGDTDEWAAGVRYTEDYVTVTASLTAGDSNPGIASQVEWSGGLPVAGEPLQRKVSKMTTGTTTVTASLGGKSLSVDITICEVSDIQVEAGATVIDADNAATEVGAGSVTLVAELSPSVDPIPMGLLGWTGGTGASGDPEHRTVTKQYPDKAAVTVSCGDSGDNLDVWVLRLDLDCPGATDSDEDQASGGGEVLFNNDDDDGDSTTDFQDDTNGVEGEDDMTALSLKLEPSGVPAGLGAVTYGGNVDVWDNPTKDGRVLMWALTPSTSLPTSLYAEGEAQPGSGTVSAVFGWGGVTLSDTVYLTVVPPDQGPSKAWIEVLETDPGAAEGTPAAGDWSDVEHPTLFIDVAPGEYATTSQVTLQVVDNYDRYVEGTEVTHTLETISLSSASGWQVKSGDLWVDATDSPTTPNAGASPKHYRRVTEWDSTEQPNGCNGEHTVRTVNAGGAPTRIEFTDGLSDARPHGPKPLSANVKNLFISGVSCDNGTIDYFKYDPEAEDDLADPEITFTIDDAELHEGCHYEWIIYIWETGHDTADPLASVSDTIGATDTTRRVVAHLTDDTLLSYLPGGFEWGTYTYDIYVLETTGNEDPGEEHDRYGLKTPYSMEVTEHGYDFVGYDLLAWYTLQQSSGLPAYALEMTPIDFNLEERPPVPGPTEVGEHLGDDFTGDGVADGTRIYVREDQDPFHDWRVVFTGVDASGVSSPYRRTHDRQQMLACNTDDTEWWAWYMWVYDCTMPVFGGLGHMDAGCRDTNHASGWTLAAAAPSPSPEGSSSGSSGGSSGSSSSSRRPGDRRSHLGGQPGGVWLFGWFKDGGPGATRKYNQMIKMTYLTPDIDPLVQSTQNKTEAGALTKWLTRSCEIACEEQDCANLVGRIRSDWMPAGGAIAARLEDALRLRTSQVFGASDFLAESFKMTYHITTRNCAHFARDVVPYDDWPALSTTPDRTMNRVRDHHNITSRRSTSLLPYLYGQYGEGTYDPNPTPPTWHAERLNHKPCAWCDELRSKNAYIAANHGRFSDDSDGP